MMMESTSMKIEEGSKWMRHVVWFRFEPLLPKKNIEKQKNKQTKHAVNIYALDLTLQPQY